ncbi:MAG: tail fiber domain-containing protein, partial [Candidatus Nanohaloarchaea archaeon]
SEDVARFKNGGSVEIPNGNLRVDKAVELSDMGFGNSWGGIKNKDVADSDYALLQKDNGQTLINTDGGNFIKFKEDDSTVRMSLDANNNVEIPNGNLDMSGNDLKNVDDVKNFTATNMFRNGDIEDSHTSNFGGDAYRTSNEAYKGTYSMVGGDSDFGQYVGAWIVRDHTTGEFKENESYTLYYYAKNTDDNERTYGFAGCGGMAVHTIPANSGWQLYRETFQIPENCGYPSAGKGETRFQVRDSHTWNGKVYFDNIVLVKGETKQDEFLPHPQDPIDNGASLDLSESELQNVDGIQDGSGTNTIHFDGSNNVDIPNGNLKVAGSAGTSSTTSGLTIDGQRNVEFLTSGSRDFRLYNHGGRITFEDSDEELLDINENGPVEIPNGNLNLGSFPQPGSDSMCWDGSGASNIGDCSSLRKYKNNITDLGLGLETVNAMQPRRFVWDKNMSGEEDIGFVAEEVENVNPIIADYNGDNLSGVKYRQYTAVLTNAVQTLDDRNEELKQENKEQEERISELESEMEELERENEKMKEVLCEMKPGAEFCG